MQPQAPEARAAGITGEFPPSNLQPDGGSEPPESSGAGAVIGEAPPQEQAQPAGLRSSSGSHDSLPPLDLEMTAEAYNMARLQRTKASYNKVLYKLRDNIALIATLVATFTYVAGINPPGGVYQDGNLRGTAIAGKRTSFRVFLVFNNMALFTSLSVVLFLLSIDVVLYQRKNLDKLMRAAHAAIWAAILFSAAAYAAASVVVMGGIGWTTIFVISVCGVTLGSVFVGVGIALVR